MVVFVPQIKEDIVQLTQPVPQERVLNRTPEQIVDVPVPQIMRGVVEMTQRALHDGRYRGWCASCTTRARSGLLGLAKKTRFAAEQWEGQVHWESVHCASSSW